MRLNTLLQDDYAERLCEQHAGVAKGLNINSTTQTTN